MLSSFFKSWRRAGRVALLLLAGLPVGQLAAGGRSWTADGDDSAAWIIYGTPESDDVLLSVTCDKAAKTLTIWFVTEPVSADPETLPLEMVSDGGHVSLIGQGNRSEMDNAFSLEAKTPLTPELETLLTQAKSLSLKAVGGGKADMALDDVAMKGALDVVKGCKK